jgi:hypothetical protein
MLQVFEQIGGGDQDHNSKRYFICGSIISTPFLKQFLVDVFLISIFDYSIPLVPGRGTVCYNHLAIFFII